MVTHTNKYYDDMTSSYAKPYIRKNNGRFYDKRDHSDDELMFCTELPKEFDVISGMTKEERNRCFFLRVFMRDNGKPFVKVLWVNELNMDDIFTMLNNDEIKLFTCYREEV